MSDDHLARLRAAHTLRAEHGTCDFTFDDDDVEAALDELEQLRAERDGWREGVVTKLEQATGQKVTLVLAPKDQCAAVFDAEVRWGFQCEKLAGHAELHRVQVHGGFAEWREANSTPQQPKGAETPAAPPRSPNSSSTTNET